jgi:hypothetical protein
MFYFHVRRGDHFYLDPDGAELADLVAARDHAVVEFRQLSRQTAKHADLVIEIGDVRGNILETVPFLGPMN